MPPCVGVVAVQVVHSSDLLARLQQAHAQGITLVLVPTHRSHLDYLLLSYVLRAYIVISVVGALGCCERCIPQFVFLTRLFAKRPVWTGTFASHMDCPCLISQPVKI